MPKMKTKKAVKNKFKVTGTGKLVYARQGRRHLLTKKSGKRKRQMRREGVASKFHTDVYSRLIGA